MMGPTRGEPCAAVSSPLPVMPSSPKCVTMPWKNAAPLLGPRSKEDTWEGSAHGDVLPVECTEGCCCACGQPSQTGHAHPSPEQQ